MRLTIASRFVPIALAMTAFAAAALAGGMTPAAAQGPAGPNYATVTVKASPASVAPGSAGKLIIKVAIAPGFHLQSAKPSDPDLIATAFAPSTAGAVKYGAPTYPKDQMVRVAGASQPQPVYTGTVDIVVPFKIASSAHPGQAAVGGTLTYQGCNQTACFPPKQTVLRCPVAIK
jgi:hypothetical protein